MMPVVADLKEESNIGLPKIPGNEAFYTVSTSDKLAKNTKYAWLSLNFRKRYLVVFVEPVRGRS